MDLTFWFWVAVAAFVIIRKIMAERTTIPETSEKVHKVANAAEFDALLASTTHVVVDFYADWCPPCRAIAPIFSELAEAHSAPGRLAFAKVNVDHTADNIGARYSVSAMPTFVFFEKGSQSGVAVDGLPARGSVVLTADGKVDRIRGADPAALKAVVQALAGKGGKEAKE